jgi:epoxyqueuosine reductase
MNPSFSDTGSGQARDPRTGRVLHRKLDREQVRAWAREAGFAEAGVVAVPYADEKRDAGRFEEWVRAGRAGTMDYLKRTGQNAGRNPDPEPGGENGPLVRARMGIPFPWAESAIVCFAGYDSAQPRSIDPAKQEEGWIARYAWSGRRDAGGVRRPSDYHKVLLKRIKALEARIRAARLRDGFGEFEARGYVDTGPLVERALATAAGLGWTGKNTCLIHPQLGSFGFLAVLVTSLEVEAALQPLRVPDRCGSCTRCLDACPTNALIAPYQMDAAKCIAYLTIEHKGTIDAELMEGMGRQVFGCDICQDVCPWNSPRRTPLSGDAELEAREELVNPALDWLAALDEAEFALRFNGSPVRRTGFHGLKRNVAIAMGNSGLRRFAPRLEHWAEAADEGLRTAARWALERLSLKQ